MTASSLQQPPGSLFEPKDQAPLFGQYLRLETRGRRTGQPHGVILRFVTIGNTVVVFPQNNSRQDWMMNVRASPSVRLHVGGIVMDGVASARRAGSLDDTVLSAFARKYGENVVRSTYWGQRDYVEIRLTGSVSREDHAELVYADLEAAFDAVAEDYDRHIFGNAVNVWLRNRSVALMSSLFHPGETVLEIGCGTGTETLSLARLGVKVIATDLSSRMLSVLDRKARAMGLRGLVIPVHARPHQLAERLKELGYQVVDGAYSTYGAVNTDPRLADFFSNVEALLRPGGRLVLGVWNRYCLYEILGYSLKANTQMASARWRNPVPIGKSRFCVSTNAYTTGELSELVGGCFRLEKVFGVGILMPPSNLTRYLPGARKLRLIKEAEVALQGSFPWNRLGDHFLAVYSKSVEKPDPA